jgi:hypothetical protein
MKKVLVVILFLILSTVIYATAVSVDTTGTMTDTGKTFVLDKFDCKATKGLLLVAVGMQSDNFQQVKDATFAGQTLTYLGEVSCEDKLKMEIWYLLNPPSRYNNYFSRY